MNSQNFTEKTLEALKNAQRLAKENGNQTLECEHLFSALLEDGDGLCPEILKRADVLLCSVGTLYFNSIDYAFGGFGDLLFARIFTCLGYGTDSF